MDNRSDYEHSCPNHGPAYDCGVVQALRERIAELEAVAVNAVIVCNLTEDSSMIHQLLERPLRAAGYLGVGE